MYESRFFTTGMGFNYENLIRIVLQGTIIRQKFMNFFSYIHSELTCIYITAIFTTTFRGVKSIIRIIK